MIRSLFRILIERSAGVGRARLIPGVHLGIPMHEDLQNLDRSVIGMNVTVFRTEIYRPCEARGSNMNPFCVKLDGKSVALFWCFGVLFLSLSAAFAQKTIYVNNVTGSDSNTGTSTVTGFDGPKQTITAALLLATTGDTVSIAGTGTVYADSAVVTKQIIIASTSGTPEVTCLSVAQMSASALLEFTGPFKVRTLELQEGMVKGSNKITMVSWGKVIRRSPTAVSLGQLNFEGKVDLDYRGEKDITMGLEAPSTTGGEIDTLGLNFTIVSPVPRLTIQKSIAVRFIRFINGLLVTDTNYVQIDNPVGKPDQGFVRELKQGAISHVVGNVRITLKAGSIIAFGRNEFPVGDSLYYRPAAISISDSTGNRSTGIGGTVKHENTKPSGIVGLPITNGVAQGVDVSRYAPFYWHIWTSGSLGQQQFNLELTATGYSDFDDVSNVRIVRRAGTASDVSNTWSLHGFVYDNYVASGVPTVVNVNSTGGLITLGAIYTLGLKSKLVLANPIDDMVYDCSNFILRRGLVNPPLFTGSSGPLTFSAVSTNDRVATAEINRDDTLIVTARVIGRTTVTVIAKDIDGDRNTHAFEFSAHPHYYQYQAPFATVWFSFRNISFGVVSVGNYRDTLLRISRDPMWPVEISNILSPDSSFHTSRTSGSIPFCSEFATTLRFAPNRTGLISGSLLVYSSAVSSPDTIMLSGFGTPAVGIVNDQEQPLSFALKQNYPNPFNPRTSFEFQVPRQTDGGQASLGLVSMKVYDVLGREVATLVNEEKLPGKYRVSWDASGFPTGVYLCRLRAGKFVATKAMLLLK